MASVRENLIAAKAIIADSKKWGKGRGAAPPTSGLCALGAAGLSGGWREPAALEDAMPVRWQGRPVYAFNDHPDTTHADIMALFDRAIAAQEPQP
jgi:hypothetical protein